MEFFNRAEQEFEVRIQNWFALRLAVMCEDGGFEHRLFRQFYMYYRCYRRLPPELLKDGCRVLYYAFLGLLYFLLVRGPEGRAGAYSRIQFHFYTNSDKLINKDMLCQIYTIEIDVQLISN